jgi:hypothetical protein
MIRNLLKPTGYPFSIDQEKTSELLSTLSVPLLKKQQKFGQTMHLKKDLLIIK